MHVVLLVVGLVLLTVGAELLVRGAARLAQAAGLSALVIGLTVVAFGTSAPELAVSVKAAWMNESDLALGNVVGSNIFNVLFILGVSSLIVPLAASAQLVRLDVPVMIGVSAALWGMAGDGVVTRVEGALLAAALVVYTTLLIVLARRQKPQDTETPAARGGYVVAGVLVVVGLALLVLGARWLVTGATGLARAMGVSELLIGLTIVAAGTSLPEVATSLIAAIRGQRDIAIGNVVGSNIFNILGVLGASALVAPDGVAVAPSALRFDLPVMTAVAAACLPIFFTGGRIARTEGLLLLAGYAAYIIFLALAATRHAALDTYSRAVLWIALPLTAIGLGFSLAVTLLRRRA